MEAINKSSGVDDHHYNTVVQSLAALVDTAQSLFCNGVLSFEKFNVLETWLVQYAPISNLWPGNLFHDEIDRVLNQGFITEGELSHLMKTLHNLISESVREWASRALVMDLPYDPIERIDFPGKRFCLTGDFIHGTRRTCAEEIRRRGGLISPSIAKSVNYFLIGSLGNKRWKYDGYETKIRQVIYFKEQHLPIFVIHESVWREALKRK
jgi:NAD-dependent DNA ligase